MTVEGIGLILVLRKRCFSSLLVKKILNQINQQHTQELRHFSVDFQGNMFLPSFSRSYLPTECWLMVADMVHGKKTPVKSNLLWKSKLRPQPATTKDPQSWTEGSWVSLDLPEVGYFVKIQFTSIFLYSLCFCVISKKYLPNPDLQRFLPLIFPRNFNF